MHSSLWKTQRYLHAQIWMSHANAKWLCQLALAWVPLVLHTVWEIEDEPGWHGSTEHSTTVDKDVFMTVWVGDIFSTLP